MRYSLRRFLWAATSILWLSAWPDEASADGYLYRLHLADKAGSSYCALSDRAMQRRERQSIALDDADLDIAPSYLAAITAQGWQIVTRSRWLNTVVVQRPDCAAIADADFAALPFIDSVEVIGAPLELAASASAIRLKSASATSRDKWQVGEAGALADEADNFRKPVQEVRGDVLYKAGLRGAGMLIAVIDGGFLNARKWPTLAEKVVGWFDCYATEDVEGEAIFSNDIHGTQVLSCMAADTTSGVWGTAPEASYFVIRSEFADTETPLEEDMWVQAAEFADSIGADLINSSLGYTSFDNPAFNHTWDQLGRNETQSSRGAKIAAQKGMLVCLAAGNDRQKPWQKICFPGDVAEVFTVGGTTADLASSSFSGAGWTSPNVKPDVACRGTKTWVISAVTGDPVTGSGTSYATPTMCGLMASLWGADPSLTPAELCRIVRESASQYAAPDSLVGYGMPDFAKALAVVNPALSLRGFVADEGAIDDRGASAEKPRTFDLFGRPTRVAVSRGWQIVDGRAVIIGK